MSMLLKSLRVGSVAGACLLLQAAAPMASAKTMDEAAERIAGICLARGVADDACQCLAREAGSRVEPDQLAHISEALEAGDSASDISERLLQSGLSEAEHASFTHRLDNAQVVIHQTCGVSFFEPETD